jgi:nitrogen fixation/metabolism regulation signal transduction histidine kinase
MISRNLYLNILLRILALILLSALLGYLVTVNHPLRLIIITCLSIFLVTINLVHYLNATNRNIRFFFDSVKNDDSSLLFPTEGRDRTYRELNASMNRVNEQIKQLRITNRNQEQFFQIMLEHIATGIITWDKREFVIHANSAARDLLGLSVLTHLKQIESVDSLLYNTIISIRPTERRLVQVDTGKGVAQLALKAASFRTSESEMIILSVEDIRKELDEKELDSWMKLIRVLTHEIMNSITPVASLSESLAGIYQKDGRVIEPGEVTGDIISTTLRGLGVIREQGKGLRSFVESYRRFTRVPEPDRKPLRITELTERLGIMFESMNEKAGIKLVTSIHDPELVLHADHNLISQVLVNLLRNAIEANENNPAAVITVSTGNPSADHPEICVSDNGPGIPNELIDEIFVPFFTTKQNGSGIGLSISRQIMRSHGGNLRVRSVPWKETSFCLSF